MTEREERIAELDEQRRCIQQLTEDDIGCDVWVRDERDFPWSGPYSLEGFSTGTYAFLAIGSCWKYATKSPPITPQTITLRRWDGGACPVDGSMLVLVRLRNLREQIVRAGSLDGGQWGHDVLLNEQSYVSHYAPIEIEVEE